MSKHDADYIARFQPTGLADWLVWLAMEDVKASQQARQAKADRPADEAR